MSRRPICHTGSLMVLLTICLLLPAHSVTAQQISSLGESLSAENKQDFELFSQILTGQAYPLNLRRTAAVRLLERGWPQGISQMLAMLGNFEDPRGQLAVAEALTETLPKLDPQPPAFIEPLIVSLSAKDDNLRQASALALANYQHQVLPRLSRIILQPEPATSEAARLAAVAAVERIKDKASAKILIDALDDANPQLSARCRAGLEYLTGIRFGDDNNAWRKWWGQYKDKKLTEWLQLYITALDSQNRQMQKSIEQLTERLRSQVQARWQVAQDKPKLLAELLADPLAEVRLQALYLAKDLLTDTFPEQLQDKIRQMISDSSPPVRALAAGLLRDLRDAQAAKLILAQLPAETDAKVRASFADALGYLASAEAVAPLMLLLTDPDPLVVAQAASALGNLSKSQDVQTLKPAIVQALMDRYRKTTLGNGAQAALRSKILSAMVQIGSASFRDIFIMALTDDSALTRVAAIEGLRNLPPDSPRKNILPSVTPLLADPDRGVRLEVLRAIDDLAGPEELANLEKRLDPNTETDPDVRQEVWRVFLNLLTRADLKTIEQYQKNIAAGTNLERQQQVWRILENKLIEDRVNHHRLLEVREALGDLLASLKRWEPAAGKYRLAYDQTQTNPQNTDGESARRLALKLLEALLQQGAFDQAASHLETTSPPLRQEALDNALAFLKNLCEDALASKKYDPPLQLIAALEKTDFPKSQPSVAAQLEQFSSQLLDSRYQADRQLILLNLDKLIQSNNDPQVLGQTRSAVNKLGLDRAGRQLLEQLEKLLSLANFDPAREKALVALLTGLDPAFSGYDLDSDLVQRRAILAQWQGFIQGTTSK